MAAKRISVTAAVRQLDAQFMRAANARDVKVGVMAFYASNAVVMPPNHPLIKGRENIRKFWQGFIDSGASNVKLKTTTIEAVGGLAYGRGAYSFSMPTAEGSTVGEVGKYIVIYRRQRDGSWRAVADIFNSDRAAQ